MTEHSYGALDPQPGFRSAPEVKNVLVTVEGDANEVAERLRRGGMQVDNIVDNVVIGTINAALESGYLDLKGVVSIHPDSEIDLFNQP